MYLCAHRTSVSNACHRARHVCNKRMNCLLSDQLGKRGSLAASVVLEGSEVFPHRRKEGNKNKARKVGTPKDKSVPL